MTLGISAVLLAITETSTWGWGSPKTLGLIAVGLLVIGAWIARSCARASRSSTCG